MLSNILKDNLKVIAQNNGFVIALRALFNEAIESEKPSVEQTDDDLKLGQKTRAYKKAQDIINQAFTDLDALKAVNKISANFNKGR